MFEDILAKEFNFKDKNIGNFNSHNINIPEIPLVKNMMNLGENYLSAGIYFGFFDNNIALWFTSKL